MKLTKEQQEKEIDVSVKYFERPGVCTQCELAKPNVRIYYIGTTFGCEDHKVDYLQSFLPPEMICDECRENHNKHQEYFTERMNEEKQKLGIKNNS